MAMVDCSSTTAAALGLSEWEKLRSEFFSASDADVSSWVVVPSQQLETASKAALAKQKKRELITNELARQPKSLVLWLKAVATIPKKQGAAERLETLETSLKHLPYSYKLWQMYLGECRSYLETQDVHPESQFRKKLVAMFERSLITQWRFPKSWLGYAGYLYSQQLIGHTRQVYDRAIQTLPITQHEIIWEAYLRFALATELKPLILYVYRRYLQIDGSKACDFVDYLISAGNYAEAAPILLSLCNDDEAVPNNKRTKQEMWAQLSSLVCTYQECSIVVNVERVVRAAIRRYSSLVGQLWSDLAKFYIQIQKNTEKARDIFEEALISVVSIEDFVFIFEAYTSVYEGTISALIQKRKNKAFKTEKEKLDLETELDLNILRLEDLLARRPVLLSSVKLRQNPHNVYEWLERVRVAKKMSKSLEDDEKTGLTNEVEDPLSVLKVFSEAVMTVDDFKATGKLRHLWTEFANFYKDCGDLDNARDVLKRACEAQFRSVDELALMWCQRIEFELLEENYEGALELARDAVRDRRSEHKQAKLGNATDIFVAPVRTFYNLSKDSKLWGLRADLEESIGTYESCRACYEHMVNLKVITVNQVLAFGEYLESHRYFEDMFQFYETALHLFNWPHANAIWLTYLPKFVSRYGSKKVERARDLFEEALLNVPRKFAFRMYFMYAQFEEQFGLSRHCLDVLNRATTKVQPDEQWKVYKLLIAKTVQAHGALKARSILQRALETAQEADITDIAIKFVDLEINLLEFDRVRAIFAHASQFCHPAKETKFWDAWKDFEINHGSEETFQNMLRQRRVVKGLFAEANTELKDLLAEMKKESDEKVGKGSKLEKKYPDVDSD